MPTTPLPGLPIYSTAGIALDAIHPRADFDHGDACIAHIEGVPGADARIWRAGTMSTKVSDALQTGHSARNSVRQDATLQRHQATAKAVRSIQRY